MNWTREQQIRYQDLLQLEELGEVKLGYWNSDAHGRPCNGGKYDISFQARMGLVEEIEGPLELCGNRALHATLDPIR